MSIYRLMSSGHNVIITMNVSFFVILLATGLAIDAAVPSSQQRIVGGSDAYIQQYPFSAALLHSWLGGGSYFYFECGGTIVRTTAVLTAAHCVHGYGPHNWRVRAGSNFANFGGLVYSTNQIIVHPGFNLLTRDSDIAILRLGFPMTFGPTIQQAGIAGATYNIADNSPLWAIGWGATRYGGPFSENLRQVQVWSVNQAICRNRYALSGYAITDNMLCSGWLDVGGRDQCDGDNGSPVIHGNAVVGIRSWGQECGLPFYPGVSTRVSRFSAWIVANA